MNVDESQNQDLDKKKKKFYDSFSAYRKKHFFLIETDIILFNY
jgi:hypothetical protein